VSSAESREQNARRSWRETLIDELFHAVHIRNCVYFRCELRTPWGLSITDCRTTFVIVNEGNCWLRTEGSAGPVALTAGDFVVAPKGGAHVVRDSRAGPVGVIDSLDFSRAYLFDKRQCFRRGGHGPVTRLICGSMQFESASTDPLLSLLPSLILARGNGRSGGKCLQVTTANAFERLDPCCAGAQALAARLADIVFIEAVKACLEENLDGAENKWLAAIRDPQIGQALALLHSRRGEPWTVRSLARHVAASRSLFAAKFAHLVGEPPLRYLKRLRLNGAALSLRSSNNTLSAIAGEAGYESPASFTKAFRSYLGIPPGEYRRMWLKKNTRSVPYGQWRNTYHEERH